MTRDRVFCPTCDGRQIAFRGGVLVECGRCLGRGWVSLPAALLEPRLLRDAGLALGAILIFLVLFVAAAAAPV